MIPGRVYQVEFIDVLLPVLFVAAALIVARKIFRRRFSHRFQISPDGKAVLITGCDSGFGKAAALKLAGDGYFIFAGCLDAEKSRDMFKDFENICTVKMDVTSGEDVEKGVEELSRILEEKHLRLHAVIANSGIVSASRSEILPIQLFQRQIEVNYLGVVRVFQAFLPVIRQNGGGKNARLVVMSSMAGILPSPYLSGYCASKSAVVMFANSLRMELARFSIKVSLICPDFYATGMTNKTSIMATADELLEKVDDRVATAYGGIDDVRRKLHNFLKIVVDNSSEDISPVIDSVCHAVSSQSPQRQYHPIKFATRMFWAVEAAKATMADWLHM